MKQHHRWFPGDAWPSVNALAGSAKFFVSKKSKVAYPYGGEGKRACSECYAKHSISNARPKRGRGGDRLSFTSTLEFNGEEHNTPGYFTSQYMKTHGCERCGVCRLYFRPVGVSITESS